MAYTLVEDTSDGSYYLEDPNGNKTGESWNSEPAQADVYAAVGVDQGLTSTQVTVFGNLIANGYQFRRR